MGTEPLAYSIPDAARLIGCGRSSIYKAISMKWLKTRKLGRRTLVEAEELHRFIKNLPAGAV